MAKYKCPSLGDCDKANSGEIFERSPGEDLKCPGCGQLLQIVNAPSSDDTPRGNKMLLFVGVVVAVALLGGAGYYFLGASRKAPEPVSPVSAPAPGATASGIAPSEADSKALRQESQDKLTSGDAASAEQASNKAAANEMLKLAIAKMAQSRFDEAEKDLLAARERDPKQSLVSYNLAVLRLKQGRTDDALKEFEASFMAGFSYFDKMDQDPDLDALRKDKRFTDLVAQYRK